LLNAHATTSATKRARASEELIEMQLMIWQLPGVPKCEGTAETCVNRDAAA
jgi:hypothetical protein